MIDHFELSDRGRNRRHNQDAVRSDAEFGLFLLADGMGGHAAGGVASQLTVETINDFVRLAMGKGEVTWPFGYEIRQGFHYNILKTSVHLANSRVCQQADNQESYAGMGTTLVCLLVEENRAFYTHVGDSRLYLFRKDKLEQLTEDHSLVQEQLKMGIIKSEEIPRHALRHVVTRAIGSKEPPEFEIKILQLDDGDLLLLCCDGLTDPLDRQRIQGLLGEKGSLRDRGHRLVDAALDAGGEDNISVVLVGYSKD